MKTNPLILLALLCGAVTLHAQQTQIRPSAATQSGSTTTGARRATNSATSAGNSAFTSGQRQYRNNTVLGDAVISTDPESRSLVIIADEDTHNEIMNVIKELDRPKPQVLIKVVFVEVTYSKNLDIGLEGSYTFHTGNPLLTSTNGSIGNMQTIVNSILASGTSTTTTNTPVFPGNSGRTAVQSVFGLANAAAPFAAAGATGNLVSVLTSDYQATLRALSQKGHINVLSRPSIMARNNQEAVIVVGQEVPFVSNSTITQNGNVLNTIQYNDVGIILRVTPFITSNNSVEMIVAPEISSVSSSSVQVTNGVTSPLIDKRSAETVVVTPNATTVVIGGLMQTQKTETLQKVPLLGDIPLLGLPFRHLVKGSNKQELVIFLTPYIVDSAAEFKEVTLNEANRTELLPNAFTPAEVENNMDTLRLQSASDERQHPVVAKKRRFVESTTSTEIVEPLPTDKEQPPVVKTRRFESTTSTNIPHPGH